MIFSYKIYCFVFGWWKARAHLDWLVSNNGKISHIWFCEIFENHHQFESTPEIKERVNCSMNTVFMKSYDVKYRIKAKIYFFFASRVFYIGRFQAVPNWQFFANPQNRVQFLLAMAAKFSVLCFQNILLFISFVDSLNIIIIPHFHFWWDHTTCNNLKQNIHSELGKWLYYYKRGYFRWGKISRKCWQELSRWGYFHDISPTFLNKVLWVLFPRGGNFREEDYIAKNVKFTPTRKFPRLQYFIGIMTRGSKVSIESREM